MDYIYEMPAKMLEQATNRGRIEVAEYESQTYGEDSRPLHKKALVYLPYGYNENNKYNVLYLLHGGGCNHNYWFKDFPDTVTILDNMIADKICDPCIIVTPTFYYDEEDQHTHDESRCENFKHELRNDLIPFIEQKYACYTDGDVSEDNLIKTRDHRAFAGLSLGSMTTYRAAFYNNFDLFAWYGPFSGCCGPFGDHDAEVDRICKTLTDGKSKGYELKYMFCGNGDKDIAYEEHKDIMERAVKASELLIPEKNYSFYVIPGGIHDIKAWQLHLYHALQVFFK